MALFSKKPPSEAKLYSKLPVRDRAITFFAEDGGSWPHFQPIIDSLINDHGMSLSYLTSSEHDPVRQLDNANLHAFHVPDGMGRSFLFQTLETGVFVATLPRLGISIFPKSKNAPRLGTKYVNVFHSMASTHMIYDADGFDQYDAILCVGPFMRDEIRERERLLGLKQKELVDHGYGRLDSIIARATPQAATAIADPPHVLIAPSWGPTCIFETCGAALVAQLLQDGFRVTARPHPETVKRTPQVIEELRSKFAQDNLFTLETNVASQDSLHASNLMISDWSGAAMEYAFGLERPVVFVDVERKVNNVAYQQLSCVPFEVSVREQIGAVVAPTEFSGLASTINDLIGKPQAFAESIRAVRDNNIYNVGTSGAAAARYIADGARAFLTKVAS